MGVPPLAMLNATNESFSAKRDELGQFFTPTPVATLMASMFDPEFRRIELLDAGAGAGALTEALVQHLCGLQRRPETISVTAYELDRTLIDWLKRTLARCEELCELAGIAFTATVFEKDFIEEAAPVVGGGLFAGKWPAFNIAIVNPPYRKIRSNSSTRRFLRSAKIETSNLYTGFLSLIVKLLAKNGQLVAITPRSFCNGPYFKPFRVDFLKEMSLRRLHVFESRSAAFSKDKVLQENLIVHAIKTESKPETVAISSSSGRPDGQIVLSQVPYSEVVSPKDPDKFIHLAADDSDIYAKSAIEQLPSTLSEIGLNVSTGRVVDFRAKPFLRQMPDKDTVPLIYSTHFNGGFIEWPKANSRKPNAIVSNQNTYDLLVPSETYVLVKRFTAKEERRRIVACIYDPDRVATKLVGFENHLNYFHSNGRGLPMDLAKGLAAFLNSTIVDQYFRRFSGHTQVNATDLRALKYPSRDELERIGHGIDEPIVEQLEIDETIQQELFQ